MTVTTAYLANSESLLVVLIYYARLFMPMYYILQSVSDVRDLIMYDGGCWRSVLLSMSLQGHVPSLPAWLVFWFDIQAYLRTWRGNIQGLARCIALHPLGRVWIFGPG